MVVLVRAWGATRTGVFRAVLVTSLVFGLMHATPLLVGEDPGYAAANLLGTIVSAVWWAALVLAYRTVWPGIVIHASRIPSLWLWPGWSRRRISVW